MNALRPYQEDLIEAARQAYRDGYKYPCVVLSCGGGKSVMAAEMAKRATAKGNRVLFIVHRKELCEQIEETFKWWGVDMSLCTVGMVQTIHRHLKKAEPPALIIGDEHHHSVSSTYRKIFDYFPEAKRIGFTATPIRLNGGGLGDVCDKLIIGVSTKWLIENNFLAPYDYYAPTLADMTGVKVKNGEYVTQEVVSILAKPAIYGDVVKYYKQLSDGKQAICYCASVEHSKEMKKTFCEAGIIAEHIDGNTPTEERAKVVEDFRTGAIRIICNCEILGEGFDVPDCNTTILLRPTKSMVLYVQQAMRSMRYLPGKRAVIIDHVGNYSRFGLPDQERKWSLEPKKKGESSGIAVNVRQCPNCYYTHVPAPTCPNCGFEYPVKKRTVEEIKAAKLEKITARVAEFKEANECKTMAELQAYAKLKGYKPGWCFYEAKKRHLL